jgi:integrase
MAYIRTYDTQRKRKGNTVRVYRVCWREPERDSFGLPTGKSVAQQENYTTRDVAEARRDELNAAKHTTGTSALAEQRKAGMLTFGHYARAWLAAQRVASGKVKADTVDGYEKRLAVYALPEFGGKAIASITPAHCEQFLAALVALKIAPATLKHHWSVFRAVFMYALRHKAITSNPVDGVNYSGNSAKRRNVRHHPLTAEQLSAVAASIGKRYPVYELLTLFAAYTGLRAEEIAGCEFGDLMFTHALAGTRAHIEVRRAKKRKGGEWISDALKSAKSRRTVPLPPWLATRLAEYLDNTHPAADTPTAPLWPNRALGGARRRGCRAVPLDSRAGGHGRVLQEPVTPRPGGRRAAGEPTGDDARGRHAGASDPRCTAARPAPYLRHAAAVGGRPFHAGVEVARAQHLHAHAGRVRRLRT